jgi:branched-chain amino acid aminotransferase
MRDCIGKKFFFNDEIVSTDLFKKSDFMSGIMLYEVIAFHNKKYLFLEDHLDRFEISSRLADLKLWISRDELRTRMLTLLDINEVKDGSINAVFNFSHNRTFVTYINKPHDPTSTDYLEGVKTQLHFDIRTTPNIKFFLQDFRERAGRKIKENNLWEVILVDKDGYITEASRSNVFLIKNNELITAPLELVLPGVTRKHVIRICKELQIPVVERYIKYTELSEMESVFLTGTTSRILPVRVVDALEFNPAHPFIIKIMKIYNEQIALLCQYN